MRKIDVIVPIYKGQCYIKEMISQLEKCAEKVEEIAKVSLVLVNDDPADSFQEDYHSEEIDTLAVETDQNRGIHGARVRGLSFCKGDYVLFLDQDDKISPNYFRSQLEMLGDADAVICKATNGGRQFYDYDRQFEKLTSSLYLFSTGNGILSPGQVLIRRMAVPQFWQENILRDSGADDWLLWLCMTYEGMQFAHNQDTLYEHTLSIANCSGSTWRMYQSESNMYEILEEKKYFDEEHLELLRQAIHQGLENRLKELDKLKGAMDIYDAWLAISQGSRSIAAYLESRDYHRIAIYGLGKMGVRLYQEIKEKVDVVCYIDRNADYLKADIPVYTLENMIPQTDLVIIALVDRENRILEDVSNILHFPVKSIEDILQAMLAEE